MDGMPGQVLRWDPDRGLVEGPTRTVALSAREVALLELLVAAAGTPVSREELCRGAGLRDGRAVDFAIRRLRTKIELNPGDPRTLLTVHGIGYQLGPRAVEPAPPARPPLVLGECRIDLEVGLVEIHGTEQVLTTRQRQVLAALARAGGALVPREQLVREVWGNHRGPCPVAGVVRALRELLEPEPSEPRYLLTVRNGGYRLAVGPRRSNLSAPTGRWVGRTSELDRTVSGLELRRCVVLVGPPGVGKSRLARQVGWRLVDHLPGGAWWVDAQAETTAAGVARAAALELGVDAADPRALARALSHLPPRIVIVDNVEQVTDAERLVEALLDGTGGWLLVTSSRALDLPAAPMIQVHGLEPDEAEVLYLRLLEDRGTRLPPSELEVLPRLLPILGGLPLAIELAAAVGGAAPPSVLVDDTNRLDWLEGNRPEGRHASVRAAFDRVWAQCSAEERRALGACAVFRSPFTVESAAAVGQVRARVLGQLQARSLVAPAHPVSLPGCEPIGPRLQLLSLIREWVAERCPPDPEQMDRHARWFADLARAHDPLWRTRGHGRARAVALTSARDLLCAAWWACDRERPDDALDILSFLGSVEEVGKSELRALAQRLIRAPGCARPWLPHLMVADWAMDDVDVSTVETALHAAAAAGVPPDEWGYVDACARLAQWVEGPQSPAALHAVPYPTEPIPQVGWLLRRGWCRGELGDLEAAEELFLRAEVIAVRHGDRLGEMAAVGHLSHFAVDPRRGFDCAVRALAMAEAEGCWQLAANYASFAAKRLLSTADRAGAERYTQRAIALSAGQAGHTVIALRLHTLNVRAGLADDGPLGLSERIARLRATAREVPDPVCEGWLAVYGLIARARLGREPPPPPPAGTPAEAAWRAINDLLGGRAVDRSGVAHLAQHHDLNLLVSFVADLAERTPSAPIVAARAAHDPLYRALFQLARR